MMMRLLSTTFRSVKHPNPNPTKSSQLPSQPSSSSSSSSSISRISQAKLSPKSRSKSRSWSVYLILSTNKPIKTYVGVTTDFARRLKQHNGELKGGAKASRAGRPWVCACIIRGFSCQSEGCLVIVSENPPKCGFASSCEFESKWKSFSRKLPRKRKNEDITKQIDDSSLPLLQHRQTALNKVTGLLDCSRLVFDWQLNPF